MTEKHCHFCRNQDVAEITSNNISLFLCNKHGMAVKKILDVGLETGVFLNAHLKFNDVVSLN